MFDPETIYGKPDFVLLPEHALVVGELKCAQAERQRRDLVFVGKFAAEVGPEFFGFVADGVDGDLRFPGAQRVR
jgi:hypothetical protein